jgi:hypothetical protein
MQTETNDLVARFAREARKRLDEALVAHEVYPDARVEREWRRWDRWYRIYCAANGFVPVQ